MRTLWDPAAAVELELGSRFLIKPTKGMWPRIRFAANLNQFTLSQKSVQLRTAGASSPRASVSALWGPKALDSLVDLDLNFDVDRDKAILKRTNG